MPLDPTAEEWLDRLAKMGTPPLWTLTPAQAREARLLPPAGPNVHRVEDMQAAGPEGPIPLRIYWPSDAEGLPILVWFHGGGWVVGDLETSDPTARRLCSLAGCIVISVDYRLAPEHPYPAAVDDAYAAVVWAAQNAPRFRGDATRIAVGGDSAGGNLAAVVAQLLRDRGGPPVVRQLLVYPVTDGAMDTPSYHENDRYGLTPASMAYFWGHYCPPGADRMQPGASPARAASLAGLAPAHVVTCEYDPLRDEGNAYAAALRAAGVPVDAEELAGQIHGCFGNAHVFPRAMQAVEDVSAALKRAFAR
ncbi:MAG: alpha/beta hydrolase [Dehalococcoidia bacterium]|nr:alpha/beta hydrolase [Dehalococcoidia bacterium]